MVSLVLPAGVAPGQHIAYSAAFYRFLKHSRPPLRGIEPFESGLGESVWLSVGLGKFLQPGQKLAGTLDICFVSLFLTLSRGQVCVVVHAHEIDISVARVALREELPVA